MIWTLATPTWVPLEGNSQSTCRRMRWGGGRPLTTVWSRAWNFEPHRLTPLLMWHRVVVSDLEIEWQRMLISRVTDAIKHRVRHRSPIGILFMYYLLFLFYCHLPNYLIHQFFCHSDISNFGPKILGSSRNSGIPDPNPRLLSPLQVLLGYFFMPSRL